MVSLQTLKRFARKLAKAFEPRRIVLFGSYACGAPSVDSDVDLLVVMPFQGHSARKALEILETVRPRSPRPSDPRAGGGSNTETIPDVVRVPFMKGVVWDAPRAAHVASIR